MATKITQMWHDRYGQPIPFVIGDEWLSGNVGWYSNDRPSVFIWRDGPRSFDIDRDEVIRSGAVVVWSITSRHGRTLEPQQQDIVQIRDHFGPLILQDTITLPGQHKTPDIRVGLAWLAPQSSRKFSENSTLPKMAE